MRSIRQFWPNRIWKRPILGFSLILLMLSLCPSARAIPETFPLSITPPDSDSVIVITASGLFAGEYTALILQVNTNLTTTNWVNIQTNYNITTSQAYFFYHWSAAQSPRFFRVAGIL